MNNPIKAFPIFSSKQISFLYKTSALFVLIFIFLSGATVYSEDVILAWDRPNDSRVIGYKIFYGLKDTNFKSTPKVTINSPDQTSCDISGLIPGQTYAFAAKSVDKNGNESVFSEVLSYYVPETKDEISKDEKQFKNSSGGGGSGGCFMNSSLYR